MFLLLNRAKSVWVPLILRVNSLEKNALGNAGGEAALLGCPPGNCEETALPAAVSSQQDAAACSICCLAKLTGEGGGAPFPLPKPNFGGARPLQKQILHPKKLRPNKGLG